MTVVDLHPEDLLEKDARGALDAGERARLDAHLARCGVCRFEQQLRADFIDDLAGEIETPGLADPARAYHVETALVPVPEASGARLVSPALPLVRDVPSLSPAPPVSPVRRAPSMRPRRATKRATWLLAAAALFVGGAAAAAMSLGERPWPVLRSILETPEVPAVPVAVKAAPVRATHPVPAMAESASPDVDTVLSGIAVLPTIATPVVVARSLAAAARPAAPATPVVGPAELFDSETDARRHEDYARVFDLHRQLEQHYAESREARVSHALVGRLLLDRGDPASALADFDAYLGGGASGSGDLTEEVMIGRATALDRLGRSDDASRAWTALLAAFPSSPYAGHARARLETLNGR